MPGHPSSVETLLKVDEDTILTGSSDGLIRVVQIHPDKFLGVLNDGDTGGYPIEKLAYNANKDIVGSVSHDNFVRLWDARILKDDGVDEGDLDESDEDDDDEEDDRKPAAIVGSSLSKSTVSKKGNAESAYDSDDEWEDMDDEDEDKKNAENDDSDSDSEDSESEPETANDRRKKRLKTENEKFFDDL